MRLLLCAAIVLTIACSRDDKFVEPVGPTPGEYVGTYTYTIEGDGQFNQPVEFTMGSNTWMMSLDEDAGVDREFCDCRGSYVLTSGMELVLLDANLYNDLCNADRSPSGTFALDNSTDTLKLVKETSGVTMSLKLVKVD